MLRNQASGRVGLTCRPGLTYPHSRQEVCGRLAPPQFGHSVVWVFAIASWDRRLRVRPGDWRKAGTGIGVIRGGEVVRAGETGGDWSARTRTG